MLTELAKQEPNFMQKCIERIKKLATYFTKGTKAQNDIQLLQNKFVSVYNMNKVAKLKVTNADGKVENISYALDKTFAEQVDEVLSNQDFIQTHLMVSRHTPKLLTDLGMSDYPMLITANHAKTAIGIPVKGYNTHYLSPKTLKQIPKLLEEPVMIMESATRDDSMVVFVNALDTNENPVLCAIKVDIGSGFYNNLEIDANIILSVYGKDGNLTNFIDNAVTDDRMLYWDKKMSQALFDTLGLQLSDTINTLDSNTIIHKFGEKSTGETKKVEENKRYALPEAGVIPILLSN